MNGDWDIMDKETMDTGMAVIFIYLGLLFAIFHRFMAMKAIYYRRPFRSLLPGKKEAGPTEIKVTTFMFLIGGLLFCSVRTLNALQGNKI